MDVQQRENGLTGTPYTPHGLNGPGWGNNIKLLRNHTKHTQPICNATTAPGLVCVQPLFAPHTPSTWPLTPWACVYPDVSACLLVQKAALVCVGLWKNMGNCWEWPKLAKICFFTLNKETLNYSPTGWLLNAIKTFHPSLGYHVALEIPLHWFMMN